MKPFAKSIVTRLSLVIVLLPGVLASSELRAAPLASDTVAAYRAIAVSRFEQMKAVREAHEALRARGYVFYTRPTPALLSVNCVSQFQVCKPIYLVTQGAILRQETNSPQITVLGAVISPTTHFGSGDWMIPTDQMLRLPTLLRGGD